MLIHQGKTYAQYEAMIASPWGSSARGRGGNHGSWKWVLVFWLLQRYLLTFNASLRWNYVGYVCKVVKNSTYLFFGQIRKKISPVKRYWPCIPSLVSRALHPWGTRDPRPMILAISRVSGRHPWPNPWHGETGIYPTGTREKDALTGRLTGLQITPIFEIWLPININNDEWILKLVCFLVTYNHIIKFMNNKLPYWKIWQQDKKILASIFSYVRTFT